MKNIFSKRGYIFTDKKNPENGIMSSILGVIAVSAIVVAVELAYQNEGVALAQYGAAVCLSAVYSLIGIILGIKSLREPEIFRLFPIIGIVLNAIAIASCGAILYFGGL